MPKVPSYDALQVTPEVLPSVSVVPSSGPNLGMQQARDMAASVRNLGESAARTADQAFAEQLREANQVRLDDGLNQLVKRRIDLQTEALQLLGRNALERPNGVSLPDEYVGKLKSAVGEISGSLGNPEQRIAFQHMAGQVSQQLYGALSTHMLSQQRVFKAQKNQATLDIAIDQATSLPSDEGLFSQSLGAIRNAVFEQALEDGGDEQIAASTYRKVADQAHYARYRAWQQKDPVAALASFQSTETSISPLMRARIGDELYRAASPLLVNMAKPWVTSVGGSPIGQANEPRGVRNNNPGNIVQTASQWQGEVQGNDPKYKTFATPEAGIKAMGDNLLAYQDKYGLNTVSGIVSRWAPATDNNDTGSYIATVSKALGVKADDKLDVRDAAMMAKLVGAMIRVENGKQPYSDAQIAAGVNAALGKASLPVGANQSASMLEPAWRDPNALIGNPVIDNLPPAQRAQVYAQAHSQVRQDMAQTRDLLTSRVNDAQAEYLATGKATNPPGEAEFIQAYGQLDGVQRYQAFQDVATLGLRIQQTKTLSNVDLLTMVNNAKPSPGDGFAERQRNYEILQRAVQHTLDDRRKDPMKFALQNPAFGIQPIADFGNVNALMAEVGKRKGVMVRIANDYGTSPMLMTNEEATAFGKFLGTLQTPDKARILGNIAAIGDVAGARSLSVQLKDKDNTLAVAALLAAYTTDPTTHWFGLDTPGTNVGQMYLDGKDAIEQTRVKIDTQAEFGIKAQIYSALDGVYQTPQGRDTAAEAAYGIYGKLQADGSGDVERAVTLATGGIMQFNGGKIAKPYGWNDGKFKDAITDTLPKIIRDEGGTFIAGGQKVSAADFAKSLPGARLQTYGQGSYLVMAGNDVVRNLDGTPYVLRVAP